MTKACFIVSLFLLGVPAVSVAEAALKVGFVDLQQVLTQTKRGQEARAKMQAEVSQRQREIDAQREEIEKMEAELQKQSSVLTAAARREREEAIQRKKRDLQLTIEDYQRDLAKRQNELLNELLSELVAVVQEYGKEKGYTLILERRQGGVLYSGEGVDITKEIIKRFDKKR